MERAARPIGTMLADFAHRLAAALHENYPADGVEKRRISQPDLTAHYLRAVGVAAGRVGLSPEAECDRFDAVLHDTQGSAVAAVEWEYAAVVKWDRAIRQHRINPRVNEIAKLKRFCNSTAAQARFACYLGYVRTDDFEPALKTVAAEWSGTAGPLLLVLIQFVKEAIPIQYRLDRADNRKKRVFKQMTMHQVTSDGQPRPLCDPLPALPW